MKVTDNMTGVDFLIIGAQKAGTTALFHYLSAHPNVFMAPGKEATFFCNDRKYLLGRERYLTHYFDAATSKQIKGEASPGYMIFDYVPARIKEHFPEIKLIAILRNPIDRAYSHYRMAVRRSVEQKTFDERVAEELQHGWIPDQERNHNSNYILFGEYGRILENFLAHFRREQIEIVFSEDLRSNRLATVNKILKFLDLTTEVTLPNIDEEYHVSGSPRIRGLTMKVDRLLDWLETKRWARKYLLWRFNKESLLFWIETELNVRRKKQTSGPSPRVRQMLKAHYQRDVERLEYLFGLEVPWTEFHHDEYSAAEDGRGST